MDMKRILQAMDGVATKPVEGGNDMAKFLRVVSEAEINQAPAAAPAQPATPAPAPAAASTLPPDQLAYNQLRAQIDSADALRGGGAYTDVSPEVTASTNAMKQKLAQMAAALKAKGIDAEAAYNAPDPAVAPAAAVDLNQKYASDVTENSLSKFLSIVDKNSVSMLNEGANPHKVSLPVQMAMQHYQQPTEKVVVEKKTSLLKQYFQETEDTVASQLAEEEAIRQQRVRMYSQKIAERVLMKESRISETPIEMTGDANDPVVHGHAKANPMSLKGRIQQARNQLKELANMAESDDLVVWQKICQLSKGGMFMGLEQNIEQVRHGIEQLAAKRKQGGVASRGIDKNIGEDEDPCWKDYKQVGMKKKGGKQVPNCVPKE